MLNTNKSTFDRVEAWLSDKSPATNNEFLAIFGAVLCAGAFLYGFVNLMSAGFTN